MKPEIQAIIDAARTKAEEHCVKQQSGCNICIYDGHCPEAILAEQILELQAQITKLTRVTSNDNT